MSAAVFSVALQGFPELRHARIHTWLHILPSLVYSTTVNNGFILTMSALSYPPAFLQIHNSRHQKTLCLAAERRPPNKRPDAHGRFGFGVHLIIPGKLGVVIQQLKNQFGSSPFSKKNQQQQTFDKASSWQPHPFQSPPVFPISR